MFKEQTNLFAIEVPLKSCVRGKVLGVYIAETVTIYAPKSQAYIQ